MLLIKLNGESFAAKNVHFLSLVNRNSENFALKNRSSSDLPRYDGVLFVSLIRLNGESFAAKTVHILQNYLFQTKIVLDRNVKIT